MLSGRDADSCLRMHADAAVMCYCMLPEYTAGRPIDIRVEKSLTATTRKARSGLESGSRSGITIKVRLLVRGSVRERVRIR